MVQIESNQTCLNCRGAARSRKFICKGTDFNFIIRIFAPNFTNY